MESREGAFTLSSPTNPYVVSAAVPIGGPFYGREELLRSLRESLQEGQHRLFLVHGPRRMGKSSFLLHLAARLSDPLVPLYFDLHDRANQPLPLLLRDLTSALENVVGGLPTPRRRLEDVGQSHRLFLQALRDTLERRHLVLLLDEFDVPPDTPEADAAAHRLIPYLHDLAAQHSSLSIVVAHGRTHDAALETGNLPLFDGAPVLPLSALTEVDQRRLLVEPSAGHCAYHFQAIKAVYELVGGHPWLTQLMASELYQLPRRRPLEPIGLLEVMSAVPRVLETGHAGLTWIWDGLNPLEQRLLSAIATAAPLDRSIQVSEVTDLLTAAGMGMSPAEIEGAALGLQAQGILRPGTPGRHQCGFDLLRRWTTQEHPLVSARTLLAASSRARRSEPPVPRENVPGRATRLTTTDGMEDLWSAAEALEQEKEGRADAAPSRNVRRTAPLMPMKPPPVRQEVDLEPLTSIPPEPTSVAARASEDFDRLLIAAQDAYIQGRLDLAVETFRRALALEPGHVETTLALGRALLELSRYPQAVAALQQISAQAPDQAFESTGEVYLRWLDDVEDDETKWTEVLAEGLRTLPGHPELVRRQRGARALRVRRLIAAGRPVEAAAALGALGPELNEALPEVAPALLDALESLTRRGVPEATTLFGLLRRLLPDPRHAWLRYLTPLIEEAERAERFSPDYADDMLRRADSAIQSAGADAGFAPEVLRSRLSACQHRLETLRERDDEARLEDLMNAGDLDQAEAWLEERLMRQRSPHLEERLRGLRAQRQLVARFNAAVVCRNQQSWAEAQRLLALVVGESPAFVGPDGRSAMALLDEVTAFKVGATRTRTKRRLWAVVAGTVIITSLITGLAVTALHTPGWRVASTERIDSALTALRARVDDGLAAPRSTSPVAGPRAAIGAASALVPATAPDPDTATATASDPGTATASDPDTATASDPDTATATAPDSTLMTATAGLALAMPPVALAVTPDNMPIADTSLRATTAPRTPPQASVSSAFAAPVVARPVAARPVVASLTSSASPQKSVAQPVVSHLASSALPEMTGALPVTPRAGRAPLPASAFPAGMAPVPTATVTPGPTSPARVAKLEAPRVSPAPVGRTTAAAVTSAVPEKVAEAAPARVSLATPVTTEQTRESQRPWIEAAAAGRLDEALGELRRAIAAEPARGDLYADLGDLYLRKGRSMDALRSYQRAVVLDAKLARAHHALGKLHQTQGHREEATSAFQAVVRLDPNSAAGRDAQQRLTQLQRATAPAPSIWEGETSGAVRLFEGQ